MKITCNHFDSKNASFTCITCKHYHKCTLLQPTNKNHSILLREINYWLNKLKQIKNNINEYERIFNKIKQGKYTIPVNVYGNIQHAPKKNAFDVFIKKPEHVNYGWSYGRLQEEKKEVIDTLRVLNRKELNMRKILEKRAGENECVFGGFV